MSGPGNEARSRPKVLLLSGVNLNLLGGREPEVYGRETLEEHVAAAAAAGDRRGLVVEHQQSNHESVLVDAIHAARETHDAVVINPGAFTHYSWALHDALAAFDGPVVELHLSNPQRREAWRHTSVVTPVADALICGLGGAGYPLAVDAAAELLDRLRTA
jgi:3-dehydroquinate dehydratase II